MREGEAASGSEERPPGPLLALLGLPMGVLAALCGIGGGLFAVPLLHFGWRVPLRAAVASALVLVLAATGTSTLAELAREASLLEPLLVLALCGAGVVGTRLGFVLAGRLPGRALRIVFAVVLPLAALKLALPAGEVPDLGTPLAPGDWPLVLGAGLGAGVVAPLLGVGGGLVAVPALALGTPLGFLPARAASLAMSASNASIGLWLYRHSGLVRWRAALWLSLGAIPGGVLGVQLVHQPGLARVARWTLAAILVLVAARFALDALRRRDSAQA